MKIRQYPNNIVKLTLRLLHMVCWYCQPKTQHATSRAGFSELLNLYKNNWRQLSSLQNPFSSLPERAVPLPVFSTSSSPSACSFLPLFCFFSRLCEYSPSPVLVTERVSSELSAHLAFQRHYITCCWAKLIPCSSPLPKHGLSWICPVVWVCESVLLTSLQSLLVFLSSNFQNSEQFLSLGAKHKCVAETSAQAKESTAVAWCSLTKNCVRQVRSFPHHRPVHRALQPAWEWTRWCWLFSPLLSLDLGACNCCSSQEGPHMMLACNNLPSQCCRPVRREGDDLQPSL